AVDVVGQRSNHALALVLAFVAAARRKHQQRRTPVAVDDDAHFTAKTIGVPAMCFSMHRKTAEPAEHAEQSFLRVLCVLRGFLVEYRCLQSFVSRPTSRAMPS